MKKIALAIACSVIMLNSCKFDDTIAGSYTGTYDSYQGLPVSVGTGTLVVTQTDDTHIDAVFHSAGNPDILITNIEVDKRSVFGAYYWECQEVYGSGAPDFLLQTNTEKWDCYVSYDNDSTLTDFILQGTKEH